MDFFLKQYPFSSLILPVTEIMDEWEEPKKLLDTSQWRPNHQTSSSKWGGLGIIPDPCLVTYLCLLNWGTASLLTFRQWYSEVWFLRNKSTWVALSAFSAGIAFPLKIHRLSALRNSDHCPEQTIVHFLGISFILHWGCGHLGSLPEKCLGWNLGDPRIFCLF